LFDEATNSPDANNERVIMNNLNKFLKDKAAIVVAHRLSTVKNADQIIVLENGRIVEVGKHKKLVSRKVSIMS
jgi:ATP-binding cassette subfamily B protein